MVLKWEAEVACLLTDRTRVEVLMGRKQRWSDSSQSVSVLSCIRTKAKAYTTFIPSNKGQEEQIDDGYE